MSRLAMRSQSQNVCFLGQKYSVEIPRYYWASKLVENGKVASATKCDWSILLAAHLRVFEECITAISDFVFVPRNAFIT